MPSFKEFLSSNIPDVPRHLLPSRARIVDKVALIRIPEELDPWAEEIGKLTLEYYRRVRCVYRWYGVTGIERLPIIKHLAGERINIVEHREYGWVLKLDIEKLMICLGNSFERLRLARMVKKHEVVVDMFAGIGQFTIPIATISKPRKIYAIEINSEAYKYLEENIRLNRVEDIVEPILGDCREIVGKEIKKIADRVIMGYFGGTIEAIPQALQAVKNEGGIIHFHELVRRGSEKEYIEEFKKKIEEQGFMIDVKNWRIVKSYSKTRNHIVIDFYTKPNL
ncbi:MAG: class I SAM-dependent methyltransferase family protein [Nitrososphaerota archaeon]